MDKLLSPESKVPRPASKTVLSPDSGLWTRDPRPLCPLDAWKAAVAAGQAPPAGILRKAFVPDEVKAVDGAERVLQFTISTAGVDRDNDTIAVAGWDLADFQ